MVRHSQMCICLTQNSAGNLWEPTTFPNQLHHLDPSGSESSTWHPKYALHHVSIVCWTTDQRVLGCLWSYSWTVECVSSRWKRRVRRSSYCLQYCGCGVHNHQRYWLNLNPQDTCCMSSLNLNCLSYSSSLTHMESGGLAGCWFDWRKT